MTNRRELAVEDYVRIAQRRKWLLMIPAVVFCVGAYAVSVFLAPRFKSETVVLVEPPAVSPDIVKPMGMGDTNQRLATMREEILSRTRLQQIIEKFDLYKANSAGSGRVTMEELVGRLRNSIDVSAVKPMDRTNANGLPGFTIDVTADQAVLAQQICTEITSMFLQQNVIVTERKADDTTEFLTKQLEDAKAKLDEEDAKLADFQRRYMGSLPDESQNNFSLLTGLSSQLESVSQALDRGRQEKLFLEQSLSQQVAAAKLTTGSDGGANPDTLQQQRSALADQLRVLRGEYTDEHPDVIKLKAEIAQLDKKIKEESTGGAPNNVDANKAGMPIETPQIMQLRAQIRQLDLAIQERTSEESRLREKIRQVQGKLELTPAVAQQYKALTRDYQTALGIYNDFLKKQSDSEVSRDLLRRQQGEQFRVLDPPSLSQRPTFPNRQLFAFGGFAGGLVLGCGIVFLLEMQDTALHTEKDVEHLLKLPVLALIPFAEPNRANSREGNVTPKVREEAVDEKVGA